MHCPDPVAPRIEALIAEISRIAKKCGRDPGTVRLVVVSKKISVKRICEAIQGGARILGENYIQEAKTKIENLAAYPTEWHFIGHLQTNKAKTAVGIFDLIHTVDSFKQAEELNKQAEKQSKIQKILIQVNLSDEKTKSGVAPEKVENLVRMISGLNHIALKGLMTLPPPDMNPEKSRPYFKQLRLLARDLDQKAVQNVEMNELSMGMSADYKAAIEEGATLIRIGTAIFGDRG
jgi:PLP dependent protein